MHSDLDFFSEFSRTHRVFTNHINRILEKHELSSSYWRVLRILDRADIKNFGNITDELQIEKPALTKIIKKLEVMNIVEVKLGHDKREKIVMLTELGKTKLNEIREEIHPFVVHALQGVSSEELEQAKQLLKQIKQNIMTY